MKTGGFISIKINTRRMSIIVFSLYSSWLLSFLFQGQILISLINQFNLNAALFTFSSIIAHFIGLLSCGFILKSTTSAKRMMIVTFILSLVLSVPFFFPETSLWLGSILIGGLISGLFVGAWGFFYKNHTPKNNRMKTAADVLIYSNLLMILINVVSAYLSYEYGLALAMLMLIFGLGFAFILPKDGKAMEKKPLKTKDNPIKIGKPLVFLYLFIVIITINSGLMYQVFIPAYGSLEWLTSWYWAVPYVGALVVMRNLPKTINRTYILYIAIAMIGFSFIGFMGNTHNVMNYIAVNTLMMGACGIYDLFWWSILGELLEFSDNPAKIFGVGLSGNVLGVFLGIAIGNYFVSEEVQSLSPLVWAMAVVMLSFLILPPLHKSLSSILEDHAFLKNFYEKPEIVQKEITQGYKKFDCLSERESQVATLLLQRKTYRMIAEELFISENTVKYYVKNIYSKYHVQSRAELIETILKCKD